MPKLLAALRARDQHLGIAASVENVAWNVTEPPLNFNSARANPRRSVSLVYRLEFERIGYIKVKWKRKSTTTNGRTATGEMRHRHVLVDGLR